MKSDLELINDMKEFLDFKKRVEHFSNIEGKIYKPEQNTKNMEKPAKLP